MMTVHGRADKTESYQNGYVSKMVYNDAGSMMNRSWNGYMFKVSPLSLPNGNYTSQGLQNRPPRFNNETRTTFSLSYDADVENSQFDSLESEPEYVTLDNNYFLRTFNSPPSRHLSILDFKRNEFNNEQTNSLTRQSHSQSLINVKSPLKDKKWQKQSFKKLATNIGAALSLSPRGESLKRFPEECAPVKRERSKSVGDLIEDVKSKSKNGVELCLSDDDDNDDFGFLGYPKCSSSLSLAMNKAKSPSSTHKILPKRFRSKTRPLPVVNTTLWSPEGDCCWCNVSGRKVVLKPSSLNQLTEAERHALQKIVLSKLQAMNLGCTIIIPKESPASKRKRKVLAFKKSHSANLGALIDKIHDKDKENKECQPVGLVFGIPLSKCIANDSELKKVRAMKKEKSNEGDIVLNRREQRKSSSSSHSSLDNYTQNGGSTLSPVNLKRCAASSDSLSESDCSRNTTNSSLVDALSLSTSSRQGSLLTDNIPQMSSSSPQVPHIVNVCCKHIEKYGLRVLGIFRVGASKKRVKQIRDEFDCGKDVHLDESYSPHDVGALLKVYFRDLPEPLLTRDLYTPFVATRKLPSTESKSIALQYLVALLPVSNRDTLQSLLNFLAKVDQHSTDCLDTDGQILPGNKMDAHNLATLFGPNILHKCKGSEKEYSVESAERAEESKEVIEVVKELIESHEQLFQVSAGLRDDVLKLLLETDPETADKILKSLGSDVSIEPDPDTTSSSIYDDSDTASIPRSPCSETEINQQKQYEHVPLRNSKSEEMMSPRTRRRFFFSSVYDDRNENNNTEKERPHFQLERSPSPQLVRNPRSSRPPRLQITKTSSPAVVRRNRSNISDRPQSENLSNSLAIPKPQYSRQHSTSAINTDNTPSSSDSGHWSSQSPLGETPRTPRSYTSRQRPLGFVGSRSRIPFENSDWERERWRQWEMLAQESVDDQYEKETLV